MKIPLDPLVFAEEFFPGVHFYKEQQDIIKSVVRNDETFVPAGNMLGKDFVAGFICLWFFLTRYPCRIVTTSAGDDHLRVLWGEIGRFIDRCKYPLDARRGGPLIINHQDIRRVWKGKTCKISYLTGLVASPDNIAKMQGHHANPDNVEDANDGIPRTLFVADECSSVVDDYYKMAVTWAKRVLAIGNTWPCENFWKRSVEAGDILAAGAKGGDGAAEDARYYRKIIRIKAEDSPNVRIGLAQKRSGQEPTNEVVTPGVITYDEYCKRRTLWGEVEQTVSLDAQFWKGADIMLVPASWYALAERRAMELAGRPRLGPRAGGCDAGEGQANTTMTCVDGRGLINQESRKTPDTSVILGWCIDYMRHWNIPPERFMFDRGGGGKQIADMLRTKGYNVQTVGFGEPVNLELKRGLHQLETRKDVVADRYVYKNRRAEMFGEVRHLLNPNNGLLGYAIPAEYAELRRQLTNIPMWWDEEGRMYLPPKQRKTDDKRSEGKVITLNSILGCSPDEADSFVMAVYALQKKPVRSVAQVF